MTLVTRTVSSIFSLEISFYLPLHEPYAWQAFLFLVGLTLSAGLDNQIVPKFVKFYSNWFMI